jgi:hypothetical protein
VVLAGNAMYVIMAGSCQVRARTLQTDPAASGGAPDNHEQLLGSLQQYEQQQQQQQQLVQPTASTIGNGHSTLTGNFWGWLQVTFDLWVLSTSKIT